AIAVLVELADEFPLFAAGRTKTSGTSPAAESARAKSPRSLGEGELLAFHLGPLLLLIFGEDRERFAFQPLAFFGRPEASGWAKTGRAPEARSTEATRLKSAQFFGLLRRESERLRDVRPPQCQDPLALEPDLIQSGELPGIEDRTELFIALA